LFKKVVVSVEVKMHLSKISNPKTKNYNSSICRIERHFVLWIAFCSLILAPMVTRADGTPQTKIRPAAFTTLVSLPDSEMKSVTGTGLQPPPLAGNALQRGSVTLWDELKTTNTTKAFSAGSSTITINGQAQ